MKPFTRVDGHGVAVLDRANVDTDQIMPKQFLKRIERTGFGEFLFFDWRRAGPRTSCSTGPSTAGAKILLAGRNFGCGSSREHAAWALEDSRLRGRHRALVRRHLPPQLRQDRPPPDRAARRAGQRADHAVRRRRS